LPSCARRYAEQSGSLDLIARNLIVSASRHGPFAEPPGNIREMALAPIV
jgi:hypothetical protein